LSLDPTSVSLAAWKHISLEYFKLTERKERRNNFKQKANKRNLENETKRRERIITGKKTQLKRDQNDYEIYTNN